MSAPDIAEVLARNGLDAIHVHDARLSVRRRPGHAAREVFVTTEWAALDGARSVLETVARLLGGAALNIDDDPVVGWAQFEDARAILAEVLR